MVQYFRKRPVISQSSSDAGTDNTDEASSKINHTVETSDTYMATQVKHSYAFFKNIYAIIVCMFCFCFSK